MSKKPIHDWLKGQRLPFKLKAVLRRLCDFTNESTWEFWAMIQPLAHDVGCCERTVQYALRELEARGLILRTDRRHKNMKGRPIPIYRLAPERNLAELPHQTRPMEERSAMHPVNRNCMHPYMDQKERTRNSKELSLESEDFVKACSTYPKSANTNRDKARKAWASAVADVGETSLLKAVENFARHWTKHPRTFDAPGFHRWLQGRDYAIHLPAAGMSNIPPRQPSNVPETLLQDFEAVDPTLVKYLRECTWSEDDRTLTPLMPFGGNRLFERRNSFFVARDIALLKHDGSRRD